MPVYQAVILALVQAITEFLPISSTAHLYLFPWLLGWKDPGLSYTMAVHMGTVLGLVVYFFRTWLTLGLNGIGIRFPTDAPPEDAARWRRAFWYMVAATVPAAVAGVFLESYVETTFRSAYLMGAMLIVVGVLMWIAEARAAHTRSFDSITFSDAMTIGFAQAIALVPGVSRSGITITAGLFKGLTREAAARFTFLLSMPIVAGASAKKFLDLRHAAVSIEDMQSFWIGGIVSAIASYLVIAFLLRYLQTHTLRIFVVYRILFGILILLLAFLQTG